MIFRFIPMTSAIMKTENSRPATFGWLQLEKSVGQELQRMAIKHPAAMGTLMYLANNMGRNNALAVSQAVIASKVGVTITAVNRAIKLLDQHRFIEVVKVGNLCIYRVNTRVAWQGNRGERFAHFTADVIAFEKEQTEEIGRTEPLKQVPVLEAGERILMGNEEIDPPDQQEMELP
jgi:Fe2+ or Zn2+ uptake regulation protein